MATFEAQVEGLTGLTIDSSSTTPTEGELVVAGDGAYNSPPLHITMTSSTTFNHFANMVNSNLAAGENGIVVFGYLVFHNNYVHYYHILKMQGLLLDNK